QLLNQQAVVKMAAELGQRDLILIAGRYEGIDERLIKQYVDEEWSIGDYVLSGGEMPALIMIDAIARMLPDVLGDTDSAQQDSFMEGLLDCPHYTRPEQIEGDGVPEVLLSGDHQAISIWREKQALGRTWLRRPELLEELQLTEEQKKWLGEFQREHEQSEH
ncbi:MAG: tRNA (guanosine(37)-N1)-methyltransferase TrmD, partial [Gammaproteobacteria bacterium]|nr:tRNA (guanosine(37)-N1)-methyltransferase TrmD [Gammaproteobacteria bacterium]